MNNDKLTTKLLAEHYQKGRQEAINEFCLGLRNLSRYIQVNKKLGFMFTYEEYSKLRKRVLDKFAKSKKEVVKQ